MKPDIKGLLKLGRFLQRVPRKQFDQGHWWKEGSCGTQGCVAGWAATLFPHRFKKEYEENGFYDTPGERLYRIVHRRTGSTGGDAFADGFRISDDDAYDITDPEASHQTPKRAAQAIFRLVNKLKKKD